jgi:F-type H+-transporting ATPase subunit b
MRHGMSCRRFVVAVALFAVVSTLAAREGTAGEINPASFAAAEAKTGGHETGDAKHEEGIPPWQTDLALWSLVVFVLFVFVLKKYAWTPLIDGLNKREQQVRQDLADAESARKKAEQMLADHERKLAGVQDEVREIIAEARRDADHTKQDIIATAQKEADATKNRAVAEINRAKEAALKELFDTMAGQVADATEYVLGRSVTDQDQKRLIDEALSQFAS